MYTQNAGIWVAEEDVAMYTMMAANDHRAENKVLYVRPPANILTQMEVVNIWEKLLGKVLDKTFILSPQDWLSKMDSESISIICIRLNSVLCSRLTLNQVSFLI